MPLLREPDDEFIRVAGHDAFVMLRLCRLGFVYCGLCLVPWALLFALAGLGGGRGPGALMGTLTVASMPQKSPLLWVHLGGAVATTVLLLYLMHQEQRVQLRVRHRFLRQPRADTLSVVVRDLPPPLQSAAALLAKFRQFYGGGAVVRAYVGTDCRAVDRLVEPAEAVRDRLERAELRWRQTGLASAAAEKQQLHDKLSILNSRIRVCQAEIGEADDGLDRRFGGGGGGDGEHGDGGNGQGLGQGQGPPSPSPSQPAQTGLAGQAGAASGGGGRGPISGHRRRCLNACPGSWLHGCTG
eukprot:SAG22_NODE_258_length_13522_cov_6.989496_12_plen_298_part_00